MSALIASLAAHPFFGLAATIAAYWLAARVWKDLGRPALLHPVLIATALIGTLLLVSGIDYATYLEQAEPLHRGLGLVIVLLAVPLYRQFRLLNAARTPLACALAAGSAVAIVSALALPVLLGSAGDVLATLAPKSTTAAVAIETADRLGGNAGATAVIVISTGIVGGAFGPAILAMAGIRDERAAGFALGVASHAIGTARAFQISETAGAFASLGMILNAILTILLVPLVLAAL